MSIRTARFSIEEATKVLMLKWSEASSVWDDQAANKFEATFIEQIGPAVRAGIAAMEQLEDEVARARRDAS